MGRMKVMDTSGHTTYPADGGTYTPDSPEAEVAKAAFAEAVTGRKMVPFDTDSGERVTDFDPNADLLLVSPIAGG